MNTVAIIPGMQGHTEVLLIIFVILLLFGAKKLPELSRSLGKSLSEFKKGQREGEKPDPEETHSKTISESEEPEKKDDVNPA
jgi:sec-independent protein translocase protein TatA